MARALCQDLEGNIWVGYRSGLSKIEVATGKIFHYQADPNRVGAMSNRSVTSLYTDKQGTVWVGTYWGGVNFSLRNISILSIIMLRTPDCLFRWWELWQKINPGIYGYVLKEEDWIYINRDKGSSSI